MPNSPNSATMSASHDLKARTQSSALRILKLIDALPNTRKGRIISDQLGRAGTAVGANYRASCRARSRAEFIAKIGIVEEEVEESAYWMELIIEREILPAKKVEALHAEAVELTAIMAASRPTASRNKR